MPELALHLLIYGALFVLSALIARKAPLRAFFLAAAVYAAHELALQYGQLLPAPAFLAGTRWNWMGKFAAAAAMLAMLPLLTASERRETGLTLRFKQGWLPRTLPPLVLLIALPLYFARNAPPQPWNTEALLFQSTLPGIDEELAYRGLMLAVLNVAFGRPWEIAGTPVGPALFVTSIMFGVAHGVSVKDAHVSVNGFNLGRTTLAGLLYGYIMESCGTLLAPVVAHNLSNTARYLFVMWK
ncbi:MAG: CPBP family intramembrane metalloprotease [Planctomycetes bacterium]|nr:CPBP family intramembrane metalloprotease [Planctomycetota bacterium]